MVLGVRRLQGVARALQDLRRGTQGVEEFLELLVSRVLVGVADVAPVMVLWQHWGKRAALWAWG